MIDHTKHTHQHLSLLAEAFAALLEKATQGGKPLHAAIQDLLPGLIKETKKVLFNGDNYAQEWHTEAEKRGLPNLKNTVDALPVILRKDSIELFGKYRVYSERELHSRYNILCEGYVKTVNVEARLTSLIAKTMILPAALRYQADVATAVNATKAAGVDNGPQVELLRSLTAAIGECRESTSAIHPAAKEKSCRSVTPRPRPAERRRRAAPTT